MEQKCHYKLYKSGKLWVTALISTAMLGGLTVTAHADTQEAVKAQPSPNQQASVTTSASQSLTSAKTVVLKGQNDQNTQPQSAPAQDTTKGNDQKQAATAVSDHQSQVASPTPAEKQNVVPAAAQTKSTVTVTNPTDYPQAAAALVGKNSQGQPYYVFQVVKLNNKLINSQQGVMICAVDPNAPQGTVYVYITTDQYRRVYQTIAVLSGQSARISVGSNGLALKNPNNNQIYLVSNTAPQTLNFNHQQIRVPASLAIKSSSALTVSPIYGLGNQQNIKYTNKVDITPDNTSSSIQYIYRDKNGNYISNPNFPANVPVNGLTGQQFTIPNANDYKQVLKGYYLTNHQGSLANNADGSYTGSISQFEVGKYYQKTLYNYNGSIFQQLIYHVIDPEGTMDITMLEPGEQPETLRVAAGTFKTFKNGTLARNPFVKGNYSIQLIYADMGHIIPVDENGNPIPNAPQPIYNNDSNDPHKAAPTDSPNLEDQGWYLQDQNQATIDPVNPGADTKVVYLKEITQVNHKSVTQTVHYQYADDVETSQPGLPELPADKTQTVDFTNTIKINPVTNQVISDTWTGPQQFTAEITPEIAGFYPDMQSAGGNTNVTHDTPDVTYVVKYRQPAEESFTERVKQTVEYRYLDGKTEGRPTLPKDDVQELTFTVTVAKHPDTGDVLHITATPDGNNHFETVTTPDRAGFVYSAAEAGSNATVSYDSPDTTYVVYYAAPLTETYQKPVTRTIYYVYADGNTEGKPALPKPNQQTVNFTETIQINPFDGSTISDNWEPTKDAFQTVDTPQLSGFYPDQESIPGKAITHEDSDDEFVVRYAAPLVNVEETKEVHQTIHYVYADGQTTGRPELPPTDEQVLQFEHTVVRNPWTNQIIPGTDTWGAPQKFTVLQSPAIAGFVPDLLQAGSGDDITHDSQDLEFTVKYAPVITETSEKTVTRTIHYRYADGQTAGRPTLPEDNVERRTFTHTVVRNPWTNEVISDEWTPAQELPTVVSPTITGFTPDLSEVVAEQINHDSDDLDYVVTYTADLTPDQPTEQPTTPTTPTPGDNGSDELPTMDSQPGIRPGQQSVVNGQQHHSQRLPQTGNRPTTLAGLGLLTVSLAGLLGLHRKHRHE